MPQQDPGIMSGRLMLVIARSSQRFQREHQVPALAGEQVPHEGQARLGARVVPGFFAQTHARPDLAGRTPVEILMTEHARLINEAMSALARYELQSCARQPFGTLSGGQQARLQILLLDLAGSTAWD
jgi:ATPase subunit of ABC transporter with duplicated ATPase domains